jgi:hypothetical protein
MFDENPIKKDDKSLENIFVVAYERADSSDKTWLAIILLADPGYDKRSDTRLRSVWKSQADKIISLSAHSGIEEKLSRSSLTFDVSVGERFFSNLRDLKRN